MSRIPSTERQLCLAFMKNPGRNPLNPEKKLIKGRGPYMDYVAACQRLGYDVDYLLDFETERAVSPVRSRTRSPVRSPVRTRSISPVRSRTVKSAEIYNDEEYPVRTAIPRPTITKSKSVVSYPKYIGPDGVKTEVTVEKLGQESFDPDPQYEVEEIPEKVERRTVTGPYGKQGELKTVSGVYKTPGSRVVRSYDIPEHPIQSYSEGTTSTTTTVRPVVSSNGTVTVRSISTSIPSPVKTATPVTTVRTVSASRTVLPVTSVRTQQPETPYMPVANISEKVEKLGHDSFDPDPITEVYEKPGSTVRREVMGPYGEKGEMIRISGTHKTSPVRIYRTRDIPEHIITVSDQIKY